MTENMFLQGQHQVSLSFCLVYTVFTWSSLCILPWTIFILSWHLYLSGRRERAKHQPASGKIEFGTLVPMTTVGLFVETEVLEGADGRPTKHQKRVRIKARTMEEGPRKPQSVIIILLWIGRTVEHFRGGIIGPGVYPAIVNTDFHSSFLFLSSLLITFYIFLWLGQNMVVY